MKWMRMKRIMFSLLLLVLSGAAAWAADKDTDDFFVRAECRSSEVTLGDSCMVVFRLYSAYPVQSVGKFDAPKVKGCRVREVSVRHVQRRVRVQNKVYYAVDWVGYVLVPEREGEFEVPSCKFEAVLRRGVQGSDPFSRFWGRVERYETLERSAKSATLTIKATKKPPRSTEEMLKSGGQVM